MKKIALSISVLLTGMINAQYYPNDGHTHPQSSPYTQNHHYDGFDYFPDDYYYEYPSDYYSDSYYRSMYNDYRKSISMVNWNLWFRTHHLSPSQINLILELNRQFPSFYVWNNYYRVNPRRWWYDRFYALERILGPQIFVVFQNHYYHGHHPAYYYSNYWTNYYYPRYSVMPRYRTIHHDYYRINRGDYHRSTGQQFGWNQPRSTRNYTNFSEAHHHPRSGSVTGFRNVTPSSSGSDFTMPRAANTSTPRSNGNGFNNHTPPRSGSNFGTNPNPQNSSPRSSGFSSVNTPKSTPDHSGGRNSSSGSGRVSGFK